MNPRLATLISAMAAASLCYACAPVEEPTGARAEGRECFRAGDVNSFSRVDDTAVNVRAGPNDYYRLELVGACPDVDWTLRIAIRTRGSSWICRGHDAELLVPSPLGAQTCPVRAVRRLSEAEVQAFRAEQR